jgi:exosortase
MKISNRTLYFSAFSLCLIIILSRPLRDVIAFSWNSENVAASHILLIPFISAALIYWNRKAIFRSVEYEKVRGSIVMLAGAGLWFGGNFNWHTELKPENLMSLLATSFVVMWLGGFLFFFGSRTFRAGLFPLLFLMFVIPIPIPLLDAIVHFLQYKSADAAYSLLRASGIPIFRAGVTFKLPDLLVEVAPQCSGIRSGISLVISGLLAGHLFLRTWWRRLALVVLAVPVLIFKNGLRIATLSYLAVRYDHRILTSELHREGGIPFFVLGLLMLYPFLLVLIKWEEKSSKDRRQIPPNFAMAQLPVSETKD